ncbi:MAG: PAS domain S-box protein [Chloroflexi bacterium]|nr:PAS domain S-box protein [Chloroflexota bacterium]
MSEKRKASAPPGEGIALLRRRIADFKASPQLRYNLAQQLFDSVFSITPTGIYIIQDGCLQYVNRQFQSFTGHSRDELLGTDYLRLVMPEDREVFKENALMMLNGESLAPYEYRMVTKSGETRWVTEAVTAIQFLEKQAMLGSVADVTDRKRLERASRDSDERYRTLFESAEEGILVLDNETGGFTYANPAICRLLGYSQEELRGMDRSAIHPRDEWPHVSSELEAQAAGRKTLAANIPCLTKDRTTIYVDISATTAIINKRQCTISFFRDVTERKQMEDELLESEGKLQAMFESIADGIIVTDLGGSIVRLNDAAAALYGCRQKEELIGQRILDYATDGDRASVMQTMERAYEQGRSGSIEYLLLTRADRQVHAELSTALLRDKSGRPTGFIAVTKDISERKRAEEEILQRTRELSALHQVLTSITQTLDLDEVLTEIVSHVGAALESNYTSIVMVNEDGSLGIGSEEFVGIAPLSARPKPKGSPRRIVDITPSPIGARPHGVTRKIIKSGEPVVIDDVDTVEGTNPILLAAGIKSYAGVPIAAKKTIIGVLFVHSTKRHAFSGKVKLLVAFADEAAIAIENARLYQEASTVGALREADRLKTELLANVSHDLRTPLTSIKGYTTTILRHFDRLADAEKRDFLHEIEIASDRLTELIENLLQLSKLEAGGFHMQKEPVVMVSLLSNAVEDAEQKTKGRRFVTRYDEPLPLVEADPRRIRQVLDNLLSNAVKYSPENTDIAVGCTSSDGELVVRVTDQGVGISPEELDKVFDRFYQASSGVSQRGGGVGLGLAICKGIIEAHGGRIWAESTLRKGSTFTFTIPLQESTAAGQADDSRDA